MRKRGRKTILLELQRKLTLETFGTGVSSYESVSYNGRTYTPTAFVREHIELYLASWVRPLVSELLDKEK